MNKLYIEISSHNLGLEFLLCLYWIVLQVYLYSLSKQLTKSYIFQQCLAFLLVAQCGLENTS